MSEFAALRGGLVVSCQAYRGDPMDDSATLARLAQCAVGGGSVAIRAEQPDHIREIARTIAVPVIGLWKVGTEGIYITPHREHVEAVVAAGAGIVAVDGTRRPRRPNEGLVDLIRTAHHLGVDVLADVANLDDAVAAVEAGADAVSTTLAGYVDDVTPDEPALDLVAKLADACGVPVLAEGRIATPAQAQAALEAGAWAVVVGAAITRPTWITRRFVQGMGVPAEPPRD